ARPLDKTVQWQQQFVRQPLARVVLALDGRVRRPAGHREVVGADDNGPPVYLGAPEQEVGGGEGLEVVLLVVGRPAGDPADLVEGAGIHELGDALADRVAPALVLALDALGAAELLGELPRGAGARPSPLASPCGMRLPSPRASP